MKLGLRFRDLLSDIKRSAKASLASFFTLLFYATIYVGISYCAGLLASLDAPKWGSPIPDALLTGELCIAVALVLFVGRVIRDLWLFLERHVRAE